MSHHSISVLACAPSKTAWYVWLPLLIFSTVDSNAQVQQVSAGANHTCALTTGNTVRCWGNGGGGQLGHGNTQDIGDNEFPADAGDVNVGADVSQISAGKNHTCAVTTANTVRCWGWGSNGRLGYPGGGANIGDNEVPADSGDVNVGADVMQVSAGGDHTCVVTTGNKVRCWGLGQLGQLGYGSIDSIGDDEAPADSGDVDVGADVMHVSAADNHTCALTTSNTVRCWGYAGEGHLGYGNTDWIGDDELPSSAGDVNVGADVMQVSAGGNHTCVVTTGNKVRCWGYGDNGRLGYGNTDWIGDDELPSSAGDVNVGADVMQVSAGGYHTCAVTTGNTVRCWGFGAWGTLGYGNQTSIGDDESPSSAGDVNVGAGVIQVSTGNEHTCVVTTGNTVRCWGFANDGKLGYRSENWIGDDEVPADSGDVVVFSASLPVELADFAVIAEADRVLLSWTTASETNNAGFEIQHLFERSGQTFIDLVGFVEGHGSTDKPQSYTFEVGALEPGHHRFRLKQVDFDGAFEFSREVEAVIEVPGSHSLSAAYPNPFNPKSYFSIAVPVRQSVKVSLHDVAGRFVRDLFEGELEPNEQHWITVDGEGLASGLYLYRVTGEAFTESRSLTLQK